MGNILELKNLSKSYAKSEFTLDQISFSLPYGSILGFVGENGAGKTTTISCILNTIGKDSGTVKLFGQEMGDADTGIREKIGVVYDGDNFPGVWTAGQLSKVMAGLYTNWDQPLFQKYLVDFHLPMKQKIRQYSKGMTMKLAIAAALAHHPELLILDEATSSIDTKTELLVQDGIEALLKGRTSFVIAHRLSTIQKADRIFVIDNGGITEQGNAKELMAKKGAYYRLYTAQLQDVVS